MPIGTCLLCQQTKNLVDSHFLPSASYRSLHAEGLEVNEPMMVTAKRVIQTSRHIKAHAFCGDCEDIFNRGGETWVLDKLATLTAFPLRDMVHSSPPLADEPNIKLFSCDTIPGFQSEKLVHLGMGIFWKSAVRTWNVLDGPLPRIELGPYEEPLRQFVFGSAPFPTNVHLVVFLDAKETPFIATTPPRRFEQEGCHLYGFYMNGLQYWMGVGKGSPAKFKDSCIATAPGHPLFLVRDAGKSMFAFFIDAAKNTVKSKGVMKTFEQWKAMRNMK